MRVRTKKVYYCGFCRKKGLSSGAMQSHEKHCTANPHRECRMCDTQGAMDVLLKLLNPIKSVDGCSEISIGGEECPACILAFVRQRKIYRVLIDGRYAWNYTEACKRWWKDRNEERNSEIETHEE